MPQQIKIDKFFKSTPSPAPKPTSSLSGAGGEATPGPESSRPPQSRRLSLPDSVGSSTTTETSNGSNAPPTSAASAPDSPTIPSPNAGTYSSPRPPVIPTTHPGAGSRSAPKTKRRKPGSPRGLGSPSQRRKRKNEDSTEDGRDNILQEMTNKMSKTKQNEPPTPNQVSREKGQQSMVEVRAGCSSGSTSSTPADTNASSAHPTTQPKASPSPAQSCKLENVESLQVLGNKRNIRFKEENEPSTSTKMPDKQITAKVKFRLKIALTELNEDFLITASGNQPILDALQADTRLEKVKKKLPKIHLHPCSKSCGEPNIGSPCSLIEGGRFEARVGKVQSPNKYSEEELGLSERYKIYLDVRDRPYNTMWLTKEDSNTFDSPILVDCLPKDTLLSALCRDTRIRKDRVRLAKLICKGSTGDVNTKLTDECRSHHGKIFACQVLKTPQVSDEDWEKARADSAVQHDSIHQTMSNSPDEAILDTKGNLDPQADIATSGENIGRESLQTEWLVIQRRSQSQVAELLKLDFEEKDSPTSEGKRKKKLDQFVKPYRQDFCSANPGIRISLMEKCCELGRSVGLLKKNDHRYGTCFRLGSKFAFTNRHVTEEMAKVGGESYVEFSYKSLKDPDLFEFKVKRVVCTSNSNGLDYSLLELDVPDDQSDRLPPGLGHLIASSSKAKLVTIIGHPGGRPQEANICCPIVHPDHKNIKAIAVYLKFNPEPTGGANYRMVDDPGRVTYRSVFGPGSSGSPGFDEEGNLVVMHTCGYPLYEGSSSLVEQGVKMTAIRDDLEQYDHDLAAELFPTESMETD